MLLPAAVELPSEVYELIRIHYSELRFEYKAIAAARLGVK